MICENPGNLPEQKIREKFGFYCCLTDCRETPLKDVQTNSKNLFFLPITVKGTVLIPFMPVFYPPSDNLHSGQETFLNI